MAQLGPAADVVGLSLAAQILSVHASHHAPSRQSTPAADRDFPQCYRPRVNVGERTTDAADDRRRCVRSLCDGPAG